MSSLATPLTVGSAHPVRIDVEPLLRDEYPPFGEGPYPVTIEIEAPLIPRNRLTVAFRLILSIPHVIAIWALGFAWAIATMVAWFSIVLTGRYPDSLYGFSVGVL